MLEKSRQRGRDDYVLHHMRGVHVRVSKQILKERDR
jgi:hypothetical protein